MGSDDPKTSEYAFFKKLKEGTSRRLLSQPSQSENLPTKKFKSDDFLRERTNTVEKSCEKFRSPWPVDIAHANDASFFSHLDNLSQKTGSHERYLEIFFRKKQKLRRWVAESSSPNIDELCSKGYDFVSVLIRRLFPETNVDTTSTDSKSMQLETDTNYKLPSSPNMDVCFEKCYWLPERNIMELEYGPFLDDFFPSRLNVSTNRYLSKSMQPETDSNYKLPSSSNTDVCFEKCYWLPERKIVELEYGPFLDDFSPSRLNASTNRYLSKSMQLETDTNYKLPSSPNMDACFKKCYRLPERKIMELEYGLLLDDYSSSRFNVSTKRYLSKFDSSTLLSNYYHHQNRIRETDYELGERSPILHTHCDSDLGCQYPNESIFETVPHALLLSWNWENRINERNLSITSQNEELSLYPYSSTSWSDVNQHIMDNSCGANGSCMSSFFAFYPPELTPLLPPPLQLPTPSDRFENYYSGEDSLEGKEDIAADSNNSSFPLLPIESCRNPDEDCNYNMVWKYGSALLSSQNQHFMHKVLKEGHDYPGTEAIISSGLDFDLAQKCSREPYSSTRYAIEYPQKELMSSHFAQDKFDSYLDSSSHRRIGSFNHLSDDVVNIHEWLPFPLQRSQNIDKSCPFPLLLDKSWWNCSEEETYYKNNED